MEFLIQNFQTNLSYWWPSYLLKNCPMWMAMDLTGSVNNLVLSDYTNEYIIFILKLVGDDTVASRPWEMKIMLLINWSYKKNWISPGLPMPRISEEISSDIRARIWCCGQTLLSFVSVFRLMKRTSFLTKHETVICTHKGHRVLLM